MKVSVIGAGSWGTALSQAIVDNKNELLLYARSEVARDEINNNHTNSRYLKNIVLPDEVKATSDLEEAVKFAGQLSSSIIGISAFAFAFNTTRLPSPICNPKQKSSLITATINVLP